MGKIGEIGKIGKTDEIDTSALFCEGWEKEANSAELVTTAPRNHYVLHPVGDGLVSRVGEPAKQARKDVFLRVASRVVPVRDETF